MQINSDNVHTASKILEAAAAQGLKTEVIQNPRHAGLTEAQIELLGHVDPLRTGCGEMVAELARDQTSDKRWIGIAATQLQQGFMAIERGIRNDKTF